VHHVGILYDQFMMHGQRNIKLRLCMSNGPSVLHYLAVKTSYLIRAIYSASLIQFDLNSFFLSTKKSPHHFVSKPCSSCSSLAQSHKVSVQIYYTQ